jgi:putative colanic acid biosynthesis glycosyltransferase
MTTGMPAENILQINTVYDRGGAAAVARTLHRAVNASGGRFRSSFAFGRGQGGPEAFRLTSAAEVGARGAKMRLFGLEGGWPGGAVERLAEEMARRAPNIVHIHNLHGYYLDFVRFFGLLAAWGGPVVWTLHDCWPLTGRCTFPDGCAAWREGCGRCSKLKDYPRSLIDSSARMLRRKKEAFASHAGLILVSPSEWLAGEARSAFPESVRIRVINNAVDTEVFRPLPASRKDLRGGLGIPAGKKIVLFAAADLKEERKGSRFIPELAAMLDPEKYHVVTAGSKFPGLERMPVGVSQMGCIRDRARLVELYNAADVLCVTSTADNFPNTVLEAMACGTPTAAFATGGIPEQLAGACGLTVPVGRISELRDVLANMLSDASGSAARRAVCRRKALERYSIPVFLKGYLGLYEELPTGGRPSLDSRPGGFEARNP